VHEIYSPELLEECEKDLRRARADAGDDRVRGRVDFLLQGLTYVKLTIKAVVLTKELEARGISIVEKTITDEEETVQLAPGQTAKAKRDNAIKDLVKRSLLAWEVRDKYVESIRNDFVVSYFWIKYNDENRAFNPTKRLRELLSRFD